MARKRLGFRPSLREQMAANQRALDWMADMAGKPRMDIGVPHSPKPRAKPRQLEAPVVQAVGELLAIHPDVAFAVRQNSGMASYEARSGRYAPVFFYRILGTADLTISDFWGFLRTGRLFAFEAKAPGWVRPRDDRERRQEAFLQIVRNCGGIADFVTSADEVAKALA